ncbi:MAG: glucose 1-dehydrogenase [Devosia sp.]|nr:glucose 1-dehydrogenase [Devosia sp.]
MSIQDIFGLSGKVALITGAGSGLGRAMAEAVAEAGATPVCFDRDAQGLAETETQLSARGLSCVVIAGDVTNETDVDAAVATIDQRFGRLDILFNNAGIGDPVPGLLHEHDTENWKKIIDINMNGVFYFARAALRIMVRQGSGKIVNTASMWGLAGSSSVFPMAGYSATKGAVVNFTRELALQYADKNIQVNAICPGFFVTKLGPYDESEFVRLTTDFTPMKRLAQPSEIKGTALYLASSASSFVTGACLVIDGGCMAK